MVCLTEGEYARFMCIVSTNFKRFSKDKFYTILIDGKYVVFEIKGFCDYKIIKVGDADEYDN